jgi:hypothetical protein
MPHILRDSADEMADEFLVLIFQHFPGNALDAILSRLAEKIGTEYEDVRTAFGELMNEANERLEDNDDS